MLALYPPFEDENGDEDEDDDNGRSRHWHTDGANRCAAPSRRWLVLEKRV